MAVNVGKQRLELSKSIVSLIDDRASMSQTGALEL